jgi:hypothetical protein
LGGFGIASQKLEDKKERKEARPCKKQCKFFWPTINIAKLKLIVLPKIRKREKEKAKRRER